MRCGSASSNPGPGPRARPCWAMSPRRGSPTPIRRSPSTSTPPTTSAAPSPPSSEDSPARSTRARPGARPCRSSSSAAPRPSGWWPRSRRRPPRPSPARERRTR
ncbi:hypothetical protein B7486_61510 [cyanobacterium TDX16]|nr:hypothetical protein B7486_61510 [cyanobacterium TDX16]